MKPRIGLLTIATGRYVEFLDDLLPSAERFFFPGYPVTRFVFSDTSRHIPSTVQVPVRHVPWPGVPMRRYHYFTDQIELLGKMDYLFYIDADMRFVARCAEEILPRDGFRLVGVLHPGFYRRKHSLASRVRQRVELGAWPEPPLKHWQLPFERNPDSRAFIGDRRHRTYYASGFGGGFADAYLEMGWRIREAVERDASRGITAVWHDESHLNRYFYERPPQQLLPSYCYPESGYPHLSHLSPVVLALDKDHAYFRG